MLFADRPSALPGKDHPDLTDEEGTCQVCRYILRGFGIAFCTCVILLCTIVSWYVAHPLEISAVLQDSCPGAKSKTTARNPAVASSFGVFFFFNRSADIAKFFFSLCPHD
jgi:hypothetical protein